jgi:hypothetical protein
MARGWGRTDESAGCIFCGNAVSCAHSPDSNEHPLSHMTLMGACVPLTMSAASVAFSMGVSRHNDASGNLAEATLGGL